MLEWVKNPFNYNVGRTNRAAICDPAVGVCKKGHLVREQMLGGGMGLCTDTAGVRLEWP